MAKTASSKQQPVEESSSLLTFTENTKLVFNLTAAALVLVIFSTLTSYTWTRYIAMMLLVIAFYINCTETSRLYSNTPEIMSSPLRNNIIMSYALCFMFLALFLYLSFISFF